MLVWIVLTGLHLGLVLGGTCIETYSCDKTCYRLHACSLLEFFVEGCFGYRKESYTCKSTCQRCCSGYDENDCDTPLCFGSIACPNGGTCLSPDICGCPSGFASPNCQEVDECTLGVSGCDHICTNTPGSFACSCSSGYVLAKDERKCEDIDECTEQIAGCEHLCNNDEGSYSCSCLQGYYLDNDGKSCLDADECRAEICNNHGVCFEGVRMYTCLCDAGFTGKNCQTDINECELFNGGCQDNCTNTFGSFKCSCLNGGHPCIKALDIRESSFSSPKGNEVTVFERQQIPGQLLPEACFAIQYVDYAEGNDIDIYFSSTSPWYELNSNSDIVYTFGIVFVKVNSFSIPLSLRGMEFKSTNEGFALNYGIEYVSINGTLIAGDLSPICLDFEFSESDFLDFISVDSFTKTVLRSLDNILPDWLEFEKSSSEILSVQDIKTDLVFGRNMDSVQMCAGVPDFPNHLYTVFRFDTGFTLRVLGNDVYFPKTSNSEKYCLIVDITHTYLGTVFLMIPEESRDILSALDIMQALKVKQNINIHPRGIGISLVNGVRADLRSFSGGFWNGDKTFQPPSLGEVNFWIGGLAKKDDSLFTFEGNGDIYIRISRIESMLTSMLREEWIGAVDVQEPLTFTLKLETFSMAFQLDTSTANIYTSVGGSTRTWCGDFSNPEGIFFSGIVKSNPFIGVPFLKDFDIYLTSRVYAYVTTEQQINSLEGFDMNIHKDLLKLDAVLDNTGHFLSVYISKLNLNETFLEVVDMKDLVTKMRTEISVSMDNLLSKNFEHLITNIENIWHKYRQLMDAFESFAQESEFHVYEEKNQFMETLKTNINNITENIKGVLDIVTQKTISSAGNYSEFGMKISTGLTIFDQKLTGLDIEIVYSKGDLFRCSRYDEVIKLLKGESALRFLGKAHGEQRLGNFFEVKEGYRIRGSYAINTDKRVIQLQSFINILGIKIKKDIFINETGVNFYLEGNVWGKVFAQIEASANIGKMWHELKFAVHGKFVDKARKKRNIDSQDFSLQTKDIRVYRNARKRRQVRTVTSSFQDNYLQAMKNVIRMTAYNAQIRLSNAQSAVTAAQKGVNNTKKWLNEKERKLREANEVYDNANRSLETAILVLEKAKRRFQDAITHLNERQRNFDNLCRIRSCKICIPGLRCRICFKRFWFLRIPFPCCTFTNCMIIIPNPFCVIANIICRIIRGFAFFALEAAKGAARSAMQNLDHARQAETLAQIHVNKSKVALTLAEGFHDVAVIRHDIAKWILEDATIALEGVKLVIGTAAKVLQFVIDIGLKDILDVYNCGFNIVLTSKDMPVFKVFCEVNAFRLGWTSINFKINFKNFLQSIWQAARATVQAVTNVFTGIFSGRKRRDIEFKASSKMHVLLRNIRESNADKYLNRTIDISNNITGFNDATDSDYDNRVQLFREKCNRITVIQNFMQYSFESLQDIVNESKSYINEAESVKSLLRGYKDIDSIENVTLENVGISKENANKDYNLTEDDLDQAMNETKNAVIDDPLLAEIRKAANISEENVDAETQSVESVDYLNAWFTSMKNMTKDYFNETECEGFKDCVFFSISNLYDLYEYENIPNITNIRESILDLETVLIETFQNESYSIIDTSATMEYVLNRINTLVEMNTFCAEPPEFLTPLQNQTVLNGSDVTLYCDVHGDPEPSFTWLKNDTIIVGERSSTIIILNVTEKVSFDKYTCIAGNVVANITSDDVYITVIFEDEDECQTGNHSCNHLCNNTVGSYICSCFRGYELQKDSNYICQDIDECKTDNAGCQQACINQEGSFTCACTDGYELDIDSMLCTDINECKTDNGECIYACLNFMGNHTCLCPKRSILEEDLKSCRDVTNSSVSSSISLDVDNATDVSDPDVYISVGKMFESYFRTVTTNILLVFINDLRFVKIKRIIADFTIELASENLENNTAKLVKAIVDLKAGDTFILQGKPVQAQSILPENADDLCQVRELIASHCKDGWHCTIESGLPFCREMPNDPAENDIPIIVGIVGSVLAVILLPIFVVIYVRCVKKNNRSGNRVTSDPKDIYIVPRHATQPKKSWNARKNNLLTSSAISISEKDQKVEISDNVRPEQWQL